MFKIICTDNTIAFIDYIILALPFIALILLVIFCIRGWHLDKQMQLHLKNLEKELEQTYKKFEY